MPQGPFRLTDGESDVWIVFCCYHNHKYLVYIRYCSDLLKLSDLLWRYNIPLLICNARGFIGYIRLVAREHTGEILRLSHRSFIWDIIHCEWRQISVQVIDSREWVSERFNDWINWSIYEPCVVSFLLRSSSFQSRMLEFSLFQCLNLWLVKQCKFEYEKIRWLSMIRKCEHS